MFVTARELAYWWPVLATLAFAVAILIVNPPHTPLVIFMLGMCDPSELFAKIERFRKHGLDIVTACDLAAEQEHMEPEEVCVAHFAWRLEHAHLHDEVQHNSG